MCNPIASKTMEQNQIKKGPSQQNHLFQGQGSNDGEGSRANENPNPISSNEPVSSADVSQMSAAASEIAAVGSTVGLSEAGAALNNVKINKDQRLDSIREYDVLMGRGSGPNRHSGNIHFRAIVGEIFDEFLSKHGSGRTMISGGGSDMMRIDPSTKNRLAQAVLDKITIEKEGRFLQKLNKKELSEAIKKGEDGDLIKAKAFSLMDAAMANTITPETIIGKEDGDEKGHSTGFNPHAVVYYRIIPEKQILAKIKQTFRFLRDQNEASNAEKHRQRARRVAAASLRGGGTSSNQLSRAALGGVGGVQIPGGLPGGLANTSSMAATYALMERLGVNGLNMNPSPLSDQFKYANARGLTNMIASSPAMTMNAIKNLNQTNTQVGAMDLASRLLCDLPQPKRVISSSEPTSAPSLLQGSSLAAAVSQLDGSNAAGKAAPSVDNTTKRLLEDFTLSRLANLQKQREETISAYLAMERSTSGGAPASAGIGNPLPQGNAATIAPPLPAQQLQRLFNLNSASPVALPPAQNPARALPSSASEPLSLLMQLNKRNKNALAGNAIGRTPGSHALRAFNSTSF